MSLKLDKEFYITLKEPPCLPINWISASEVAVFSDEILLGQFDKFNEQHDPIHVLRARIPAFQGGLEIVRRNRAEKKFLIEERERQTIIKTITATTGDEGDFGDIRYIEGAGETEVIFGAFRGAPQRCEDLNLGPIVNTGFTSAETHKIIFDLNIEGESPGVGGNFEHIARVDLFDYAQLFPFTEPLKLSDVRFLSLNTLTNGVDFRNEQIPGQPTFCNQNLALQLLNTSVKNQLFVEDSSIPKELDSALDLSGVENLGHSVIIGDGEIQSCSMTEDIGIIMKEYWLLEPATQDLLDSFSTGSPNDDLFDNPTVIQSMVETEPGLSASIHGILRVANPIFNSYTYSTTAEIFGLAGDETIRMAFSFGPNLTNSTNTIQFSKGKKLFAGNGGQLITF